MNAFKTPDQLINALLQHCKETPASAEKQRMVTRYWKANYAEYDGFTALLLFDNGRLVIFCLHSAAFHKLRAHLPAMQQKLMGEFSAISSVEVKITPLNNTLNHRKNKIKPKTSNQSADYLSRAAAHIDNPSLRQAFERIAKAQANNNH